ncbi:MAG: patatin-like phospholipase family protein, partial [candidate division WOR-3 bacterium]
NSGEEIIFTSGPLYKAVWASCAIPGIFPPLYENERIFIDGGTINNIPIEPLLNIGARKIIAVYLGDIPKFDKEPDTGFLITQRALSFMKYHLDKRILKRADCVITPDVKEFHWADFTLMEDLIQKGREAVLQRIDKIKHITKFWYGLKKSFLKIKRG